MNPIFYPYPARITDADDLRREFATHKRDHYPDELYQNLFDYLCDVHAGEEFATLDIMAVPGSEEGCYLATDKERRIVWII